MDFINKKVKRTKKEVQILLAAAREFVSNSGVSMSEMAVIAGVGRATLHRYFTTKDDLHHAVIVYALDEFSDLLEAVINEAQTGYERLNLLIEKVLVKGEVFHFLMTDQKIYQIPEAQRRYDNLLADMVGIIETCKKEGVIAERINSIWVVYTLDSLLYSAWQGSIEGYFELASMKQMILDTLMHGFHQPPEQCFL